MDASSLDGLIDKLDDAWPLVQEWVAGSQHAVEVLPCEQSDGEATLLALQVTTRSTMGAIALRSGGILVDHGWLRILGAGSPRIGGGLREWNASLGGAPLDPPLDGALVVAYDAVGGVFAINGDQWTGSEVGSIHYFAPDKRTWEPYEWGYTGFFRWALSPYEFEQFYHDYRWKGWEAEVEALGPDQVISIWPGLGLNAEVDMADRSRKPVPAREQYAFNCDLGAQLAKLPPGAKFKIKFTE